jgi:hypothetical protein
LKTLKFSDQQFLFCVNDQQLDEAAFHRSGFSSNRLFIEAAFHQSGFPSKWLFIEVAIH